MYIYLLHKNRFLLSRRNHLIIHIFRPMGVAGMRMQNKSIAYNIYCIFQWIWNSFEMAFIKINYLTNIYNMKLLK